jgi:hypothetical protein
MKLAFLLTQHYRKGLWISMDNFIIVNRRKPNYLVDYNERADLTLSEIVMNIGACLICLLFIVFFFIFLAAAIKYLII